MITEHHIEVKRTLRYFAAGQPTAEGTLLVALHGYAQHPRFFLQKLASLTDHGIAIVAPEGLHRFYTTGASGRVGASWMTKEDRLNDIADINHYLTELLQLPAFAKCQKKVLLGFSQGTATAVRFLCSTSEPFQRVILWAGTFPPDVDRPEQLQRLRNTKLEVVIGDDDTLVSQGQLTEASAWLQNGNVAFKQHRFKGGHVIDLELLTQLLIDKPGLASKE